MKVRFGVNDLILYKRGPSDVAWKIVTIEEDLPDVNFAPQKPATNSPPIGRSRILKRMERSPLNNSAEHRTKVIRSESPGAGGSPTKSHKSDDQEKIGEEETNSSVKSLNCYAPTRNL